MSTIGPQESIALQEDVKKLGGQYLKAPVLGSIPQAKSGELIVMVGAEKNQFERWRDVLSCFTDETSSAVAKTPIYRAPFPTQAPARRTSV